MTPCVAYVGVLVLAIGPCIASVFWLVSVLDKNAANTRARRFLEFPLVHQPPGRQLGTSRMLNSSAATHEMGASDDVTTQTLTVKLTGGLGNQLFQIAALLCVAWDSNHSFNAVLPQINYTPPSLNSFVVRHTYWDSVLQNLAPLLNTTVTQANNHIGKCDVYQPGAAHDVRTVEKDSTLYNSDWLAPLRTPDLRSCDVVTLHGHFQNRHYFANHLPRLRELLWVEALAQKAMERIEALVPNTQLPIVSIHYRFGDLANFDAKGKGFLLDDGYYYRALPEVQRQLGQRLVCLIFSDSPSIAWEKSAQLPGCTERALVPPEEEDIITFYMMGMTDACVLSQSTFAYWAAQVGRRNRVVVAPERQSKYPGINPGAEPDWIAIPTTSSAHNGVSS